MASLLGVLSNDPFQDGSSSGGALGAYTTVRSPHFPLTKFDFPSTPSVQISGCGRDHVVITKQQRQLYLGHPTNREPVTAIEAVSAGGAHITVFLFFFLASLISRASIATPGSIQALQLRFPTAVTPSLDWLHHFEKHSRKLAKTF